jgi:uncharacterized protein
MHIRSLCLVILVASLAIAEERPEPRRTIVVNGQGEVRAAPDRAEVSFAVETAAGAAGEAAAENAKRTAAVVAAVKSAAGPDAAVATTRYTIDPRYETPRPGETREPRITGYVVRNEVDVDRAPVDAVGKLVDAAVGAGANRVSALRFSSSRHDELLRAALEKAGGDAHAQAESVARGLGVRLKQVVSAATTFAPVPTPRRFEAMAAEMRAVPTPVEPGETAVSVTLQVTYEIE